VLKGIFKGAHNLMTPRRVLVVIQFTAAIVLMICTLVIYRQIDYAQRRDPGYKKDLLAYIYIKGDAQKNYPLISQALLRSGVITSITRTNSPITDIWSWDDSYSWTGKDHAGRYLFGKFYTYSDLVKTMGLTLTAGRDIDIDRYPADSNAIILNQSAVRLMKLGNPLGQQVTNKEGSWHVVGVVKDFIPESPFYDIPPIVCQANRTGFGTMSFILNKNGANTANIETIRAIFTKYNPDYPFEYYLAARSYSKKFEGEQDFGLLAAVFASLTIFISCLGLFGLAASMAENRVKEIGVRKVLGASVAGITTLLSKDFLKWVLISFVIASPLAWWTMHAWLQDFSYRVDLSWWIFSLAGLLALLIAMGTVGYQAVKAALASPAKSLRSE
jgi:ABC-type antimicrobial peptide transport system permease subunit